MAALTSMTIFSRFSKLHNVELNIFHGISWNAAVFIFIIFDIKLALMNPHKKKSMGVRSDDLANRGMLLSSTLPLPIQRCCRLEFSQSRHTKKARFMSSKARCMSSKARCMSKTMNILTA